MQSSKVFFECLFIPFTVEKNIFQKQVIRNHSFHYWLMDRSKAVFILTTPRYEVLYLILPLFYLPSNSVS